METSLSNETYMKRKKALGGLLGRFFLFFSQYVVPVPSISSFNLRKKKSKQRMRVERLKARK
jgi:hypothetical protein